MNGPTDHPAPLSGPGVSAGAAERAAEDRALMQRIAARDAKALESLYERYSPVVMGHCLRVLNDRAEAEEVVEQIFWELWSKPDRYDPHRGAVLTFLLTLTHSRVLDRLRSLKRTRTLSLDARIDDATRSSPASLDAGPARSAMLAEERARIRRSLDSLEPDQRAVVELAFFQGLSHSEIAERLSQPLGTIKTRIRAGLAKLRYSLRTVYGDVNEP
jgi:RNA polymerase sigma-70 factor (ECF subfamily)